MKPSGVDWLETLRHGFVWKPTGLINSLAEVGNGSSAADLVTDVTKKIVANDSSHHRLVVADLKKARVIGNCSLLANSKDEVIWGVQGLVRPNPDKNNRTIRRARFRLRHFVPGNSLLLDCNGSNYFHWSFETLPRLKILQTAGYDVSSLDWVVLGRENPAFQTESLAAFGLDPQRVFRCSNRRAYHFDRLIVPSVPANVSGHLERWTVELLREKFLPDGNLAPFRSIYLSRSRIHRRGMTNELELQAALLQKGFEICHPEKLSLREQAHIFASAKCIVAPHGAGLTNLAYAASGARLVELFGPHNHNRCYEVLAGIRQMQYQAIHGGEVRSTRHPDGQADPFVIDIPKVLASL